MAKYPSLKKVKNNPTYQECVQTLKKNRQKIENLPNFHFVDIGHKIINGELTENYAIRIFIHGNKLYRETSFLEFFPSKIEEISTDIISTFVYNQSCPTSPETQRINEINPLQGGISIGPYEDIATLGIIMDSKKYGICAIGTFHGEYIGKDIFQPSPQEKNSQYRKIGKIIDHYYPLDISIILLDDELYSGEIIGNFRPSKIIDWPGIEQLYFNRETVLKSGRSTGISSGRITGLDPASHSFTISPSNSSNILSCKGDSGAIWLNKNSDILGVHKEGSGNFDNTPVIARASSIHQLIDYWGLSLYQPLV